jgi:hypothetical protein
MSQTTLVLKARQAGSAAFSLKELYEAMERLEKAPAPKVVEPKTFAQGYGTEWLFDEVAVIKYQPMRTDVLLEMRERMRGKPPE